MILRRWEGSHRGRFRALRHGPRDLDAVRKYFPRRWLPPIVKDWDRDAALAIEGDAAMVGAAGIDVFEPRFTLRLSSVH